MRFNEQLKKWTAVLSVFFFLSAQPVWAAPVLSEEYQSDEDPQGFVSAEQAEQSFQNQINEVQSVDQAFNGPTNLIFEEESAPQQSILVKFQPTEETNEVSDLALLTTAPAPLPQAEPVAMPMAAEETEDEVVVEAASEESDEPQPVAMAETEEEADQTLSNTNEESASTTAVEFAAAEAETSESQTSVETSDSNLTVENLTSEEPVLLASLSVVSAPLVLPEAELSEEVISDVAAKSVSQQVESAVATELAALMGVSSVGTAPSSSSSVGVAESSMMGALPQAATVSAPLQDPPVALIPGVIDPSIDIFATAEDGTGGISRLFSTFKEAFFDLNVAPDGTIIGNGINDGLETFSELLELLSFIYETFFGIKVSSGKLATLFSRGTSKDGVALFGSETVFLNALLISAFILPLSGYFPREGATGIDLSSIRKSNPSAYTFAIPFILSTDFVTAVGKFLDPTLSDAKANLLGFEAIAAALASFVKAAVTFTPGSGIFILDPKDFSNRAAFKGDAAGFKGSIEGLFSISLIALPAELHESLSSILFTDGEQTGFGAILSIEFDKAFIDAIGELMVSLFLANLGPAVNFYRSLGFTTAVGPSTPNFFLPGLFKVDLGLAEGATTGALELFFSTMFAFLTLFGMQPPVPNISTLDLDPNSSIAQRMSEVFYGNPFSAFEGIQRRKQQEQALIEAIKPVNLDVAKTPTQTKTETTTDSQKKAKEYTRKRAEEFRKGVSPTQTQQRRSLATGQKK